MATVYKHANRIVAHLPGVHAENVALAGDIATEARALLARHRITGEHHIEVTEGKVDAFASLVGPAAIALNDGHVLVDRKTGRPVGYVEGLHIMEKAADTA